MRQEALTITKVAAVTGLSTAVLRAWEARYGWPVPVRETNGYRRYPPALVKDIQRVVDMVANGSSIFAAIGAIQDDKQTPRPRPVAQPRFDFSRIPLPTAPEARRLRDSLEAAIHAGDRGKLAMIEAQASMLRPADREHAVLALLRLVRS